MFVWVVVFPLLLMQKQIVWTLDITHFPVSIKTSRMVTNVSSKLGVSGCVTLLLTCWLPSVAMKTLMPRTSRRSWRALALKPMTHASTRYTATCSSLCFITVVASVFPGSWFLPLGYVYNCVYLSLSTGYRWAEGQEREWRYYHRWVSHSFIYVCVRPWLILVYNFVWMKCC